MSELWYDSTSETPEAHRKAQIISFVCSQLSNGHIVEAEATLKAKYPFEKPRNAGRNYSLADALTIFYRDGFIDRYSGLRLVFPGTLRILSLRMPETFPYHKNGKTDECHFAFWELLPTIDHIQPVSRGGSEEESNMVTTSMAKNLAKANFTLEEIDWKLLPKGNSDQWDGQLRWFFSEVKKDPALLKNPYVTRWKRAAEMANLAPKLSGGVSHE